MNGSPSVVSLVTTQSGCFNANAKKKSDYVSCIALIQYSIACSYDIQRNIVHRYQFDVTKMISPITIS